MKIILALAMVLAMLAIPTVVCSPASPENPAAIASDIVINVFQAPDGPGYSEVGQNIAENAPGFKGVAELAPGQNKGPI
jgi:hypothetical protein